MRRDNFRINYFIDWAWGEGYLKRRRKILEGEGKLKESESQTEPAHTFYRCMRCK